MKAGMLILVLVLGGAASAYTADYDIVENKAVVDIGIKLDRKVSEFSWYLPADAQGIEAKGLEYSIVDLEDSKQIIIKGFFDYVNIRYVTGSVIEQSRDNFFILNPVEKSNISVRLPEGAILKYPLDSANKAVIPEPHKVSTDGRRIILNWENNKDPILVIYKSESGFNYLYLLPAAVVLGFLGLFLARRKKNDAVKNLFEDEKKIVELLMGEKEGLWQKQLEIKSGLSKVKLSRKLRSLEQKGVIEKVPYGNSNRIRVKK